LEKTVSLKIGQKRCETLKWLKSLKRNFESRIKESLFY